MTTAAKEAIAVLKANGIDRIFGNPGTTELALLDATVSEGIGFDLCLNEGIAVAMADGYGRASDSVGVVMVHTSVGTANTLTNLINLHSDRAPLLVIAGDKDDRLTGRGCFCEVPDLPGLVRQVTKEAWRVTLPEKLPELVRRGLKVARAPAPGPVYIAAPENYMAAELAPEALGVHVRASGAAELRADPDRLLAVYRALASAERPLLIAGNEVGASDAAPLLADLAERLGVPVVGEETFTTNALNFPTDHPFYHGSFSPDARVVRDADLVVAIGARVFMEYAFPAEPYLRPGVRLMQIGSDAAELEKIHPAEMALLGEAGTAVRDLHRFLATQGLPGADVLRQRRERASARRAPQGAVVAGAGAAAAQRRDSPLRTRELLARASEVLPPDVAVVDESVLSKALVLSHFRLGSARRYFGTSGGGLGWGVPAAIGVQMAMPSRRVVAFVGDGGALFNIQALWTAAHRQLPVIVVVIDNGGYMAVRRGLGQFDGTAAKSGTFPGSSIVEPAIDFCAIAKGFGVQATTIDHADQVADAMHWALSSRAPTLIDARVAPSDYY